MRSDRTCAAPGGGQEVLTYSARVSEPERRRRPRPELQFSLERSLFGEVIRTCEGQVLSDLARHASEFQDAGALAVISRQRSAFSPSQSEALQPLAEVLAFAFVAQQQQHALEKFQMMESMSDTTFALASEINGALQAVVGEAAILRRQHPQPGEGWTKSSTTPSAPSRCSSACGPRPATASRKIRGTGLDLWKTQGIRRL